MFFVSVVKKGNQLIEIKLNQSEREALSHVTHFLGTEFDSWITFFYTQEEAEAFQAHIKGESDFQKYEAFIKSEECWQGTKEYKDFVENY